VDRVKSTARPMTTEELVAAGLPVEAIVEGPDNAPKGSDGD
jgi:hypothetical protein